MRRFVLALPLLLVAAAPAVAHPLPNFRYDRKLDVRLHAQEVEVRYELQLSFWTIFADNRKLFTPEEIEQMGGKLREVTKRYCEKMGPVLAERLEAKLGGRPLTFRCAKLSIEHDRDHAKFHYVLKAPWRVAGGSAENAFAFRDHNFETDVGVVWLTLDTDRELKVKDAVEPEDLRGRLSTTLQPDEAERFLRASAVFAAPTLPSVTADEATATPQAAESPVPAVETEVDAQPDENFFSGVLARGPKALFDTNYGSGVLLLLAMVFGAFHAFAPGHGKSVAAAFLVGEQGTFRQAALLGLSTTFAHTGSVILIAGVFYLRYREAMPQEAQHYLGLVGGLLVLFVGMWLFMRRLRGRVDHLHLFGGCSDMCGNHAPAPKVPQCRIPLRPTGPVVMAPASAAMQLVPKKVPLSWVRVVLLGIGAGAIPCVDAVLLLMLAVSAGKLAFALPLLVSFSVGLSSVLMLIGALVVVLHRAGRSGFGERPWFRLLPTASAVLLMGMGLWMARDAWKGFAQVG
jgi:ABC-type nickel/cobalt efflux system permease component RcnA